MSKSTPIANLPNLKKQGSAQAPAHEQHENQIVKEILNEIDNSSANANNQAPPQPPAQAQPSAEEQAMLQQQIQQQMMEQQLMEEQMRQQQMMQEQAAAAPTPDVVNQLSAHPQQQLSMMETLMSSLKPTVVVAAIVAILSLPFVADTINKIVASKESLKKMALPIMLAIKALVGGGMFFAANNSGMLN